MKTDITSIQSVQSAICKLPPYMTPKDQQGVAWFDRSAGSSFAETPFEKMTPVLEAIKGTLAGENPDVSDVALIVIKVGAGIAKVNLGELVAATRWSAFTFAIDVEMPVKLQAFLDSQTYAYDPAFDANSDGA